MQLPPGGLGDEGRRRLDVLTPEPARWWSVLLVACIYCSGIFVWRYYWIFPISCMPNGL
jgi:hypothetical protein